jgi:hypothetical protein
MNTDFGSIWDWLLESNKSRQCPAASQAPAVEVAASHAIDDLTLLALEREAEAAAKLRQQS